LHHAITTLNDLAFAMKDPKSFVNE